MIAVSQNFGTRKAKKTAARVPTTLRTESRIAVVFGPGGRRAGRRCRRRWCMTAEVSPVGELAGATHRAQSAAVRIRPAATAGSASSRSPSPGWSRCIRQTNAARKIASTVIGPNCSERLGSRLHLREGGLENQDHGNRQHGRRPDEDSSSGIKRQLGNLRDHGRSLQKSPREEPSLALETTEPGVVPESRLDRSIANGVPRREAGKFGYLDANSVKYNGIA